MTKNARYIIIFLFAFASIAIADQGDGDGYGYNWTDSGTPAPTISYSWVDLAGETSVFGDVFDDSVYSVTLPFSFTLYGTSKSQLYISSNGWISFIDPGVNAYPVNVSIPNGGNPNELIAPFWYDLQSTTGNIGGVYYRTDGTAPNQQFIIEWDIINGSDSLNFEAILYEHTNMIKFQYNRIDAAYGGGSSATIGIEEDGSQGFQYSNTITTNSAILFHNESVSDYSASLLPASVEISDFVSFTYTINNITPVNAQGVGKIDRIAIGNPFSTTPTITSVTIDGQSALIQNTTAKPTDPEIATWYYKTAGATDSLIIQTTHFNVAQSVAITYLQAIPEVLEGNYTYGSTVDAELYTSAPVTPSSQPQVSVTSGSVDYIIIRDASDGGGSEVTSLTMTTDESLTLYAAGYDAGDNYIDDMSVTWTLTGNLDGGGGAGENFIFDPSLAPRSGTIEAELVSIEATDATGTITVNPGALATLQIRTAENEGGSPVTDYTMTTDDMQRFWAAGYDTDGNYRGDEWVGWSSTLGIEGSGESIDYNPSAPITGTLTATGVGDVNFTANIDVATGVLDYLTIKDAPGGVGVTVINHIMNTDQTLTLYAAGYDAENNYKEDYVAVWTLTGTLDQTGVTDSIFVFSPSSAPTSGSILATVGNISDATGTIEVNPGILASLQIRTAPNNGGSLVTTFSMTTDDSQTFWAAGFDSEGNFIRNESVTWSSAAFGVINQSGDSLLFQPTAPDNGTLTATSGIISYTTGDIEVTVGDLNYLIIRDGANDTGNEFTTLAMTTDESITLYAAGYDAHGNFRQDENADWTLTGELDGTPVSDTVFVFDPSVAPTSGTINAQIGTIQDATGTITVNTGVLSSLLIRTDSNNGGYQVFTFSMTTDESQTFWSAGYDADGNYRGDEATTDWTSTGDLGLSGTGDSIIFTPSAPVSGTLIATVGGSISYETGLITVGGGGVDHIIIRDAPDGGGNEVITHAMTTDESLTLYAAGYDEGDTFVENTQVNWTLTGGLDGTPVSDTVFVFSPALAPRSGTINAQIGTIQDATGTINVSTGALADLLMRNAPNNGGDSVTTLIMSAGDSRTFYAAGYDADGNYRRDEPDAEWTSTFGLGGSGSFFVFTPTLPDTGTITVTIDAIEYTTGDIIVLGGSLGKLVIRDGPYGGGNDLTGTPIDLSADGSITLYAAGYDASDNYIGDQVVDWFSTGTLDYIDVTAPGFTFTPVNAPSSGTIGITDGTYGNTTGLIDVSVGALNYITINDGPGAGGMEVNTDTLTAGIPISFYAVGYDSDDNYRSEVVVDWSSTGNLDEVTGTGTSIVFNPVTAPSTGTIVADTAGIFTDETGLITVEEGNLDYIEIRTAAGGAGVIVGDTSLTTDQSLTMYAAGYDGNDNYLYDVPVSWSSTGSLDVVVETGPSFTFNPATAPTGGTIVATSGLYSGQTGTITVSVGALDHITINSSSGAGGVPVETLSLTADDSYTFYAASYDADNNFIAMVAAIWDQTGNLNDVFGTGTSYTFNPVTAPTSGTITAIFSDESDATGTITIEPGALDYVLINDAAGAGGSEIGDITLNVGVPLVLYASGYDQHGNYRGPEEAIWRSTGSLDDVSGVSENYTFTPISVSSGTIIATSGIVSDTTGTITVEEGVLTWIQIRTAPNGEGPEFGTHSLSADESVTLYAAGYDAGDNFIEDIVVNWTTTPTLEPISETGTSFEFSPTVAPTSGTIRATHGVLTDETGTITVSPGAPVSVKDYDDLSGERTTVAGSTQLIRVLVEDQHGNPVSGVTVNFSPADDMSVPSDITDADGLAESVYNTPRNQDTSIVQASVSGLSPYNFIVYGINYVSGSLDPAVVQRGGTPTFTVQVSNPGNTAVPLTTGSSNFSFDNGSFSYSANLISPSTLAPNSSAITLTFIPTLIDENFPGGSYTAEIQLVGSGSFIGMNGVLQTDIGELTIGDENITIGSITIIGPEGPTNQLLQGEQDIIARIIVTNVGNVLEIDEYPETRIEFRRNDNGQSQPVLHLERTDDLQFLLSGGVQNELEFQFDLPPDYQTGQIDVYAVLSLDNGTLVKAPEDPSGSFNVLQAGNANYVEGSLSPDEVVPRETVYFSASFENTGSAPIVLSPAASTIEILGTGIGPRNLISQFTLTGNTTTELHFDPLTIPVGLSTGTYDVRWHLYGTLGSHVYDSIGVITDELTVVSAADLSFSTINVVPDRVKQGQTGIDIIYTISNQGESAANITALDHQFNFSAGGEVPPFQWNPTPIEPGLPVQVTPGGNIALTATYFLSSTATTGMVYPNPTVTYHDTRTPTIAYNSNTITQNDTVEVVQPASVKIVQLQVQAPNTPFVNKDQEFSVNLTLENTGADQIDTAWVSIYRNEELFTDQLVLTNIAPGEQKSAGFQHSEPNAGIFVYKAYIDSAKDAVGDPVVINQPDDRDELIYVQEPSRLEIDASILSNLIVYDSLIVSEDQIFMVRANITNFGESSFSADGNGRLALRLPGTNFTFENDPADSIRTFTAEDTLAEWAIQSMGISPGGTFEALAFSLIDIPIDVNTGEEIEDISIIDSVVHIKSEEKGTIIHNQLSILSPDGAQDGILSTEQEFIVRSDIQYNSTIALDGRTAEIDLPDHYSLIQGQTRIIDLSTGAPAEWTIIALDHDQTGDEIFVTARGYDRNSGLPLTLNSNVIGLSVVERTDLSMSLQILKTGGSPGDTLSVGQKFTLQALVNNDGTARAIGEGKVTIEGIEDNDAVIFTNLPQEDTLSFTIGEPVSWDLEIIQLPGGQSGIQPQIFQLMKELDKETAKTVSKGNNKITTSTRARELFNQISDMTLSLVTLELNLTVKMSQIPEDENTNQTAYTQDSIVTKTTYVQPVAGITIQLIETPASISTDQEFDLVVTGNLINNLKDPSAHLLIPPSFEDYNGSVLDLPLETGSDQAHFKIKVPPTVNFFGAARETLKVYLTGEDLNSGEQVLPSPTVSRVVTVQLKPEIYMAREIISPLAARESGSLSHGQSITIEVWPALVSSDKSLEYAPIDNDGSIDLDSEIFSRYQFERVDGEIYKKTFTQLNQKLRFTLRAPRQNRTALINLRFIDLPVDNNSRNFVDVDGDSGSVSLPMTVTEKKITVIMQKEFEKTTFTRGEGHHLIMAFDISNAGYLDSLTLQGLGIKFIARSDTASLLNNAIVNIFEKIFIVDYDEFSAGFDNILDLTSYAEFEVSETNVSNPLQIEFDDLGYLNGNESKNLAVVAMFRAGESSRSFRTILNNVDAYDDSPENLVSIIDGEGRSIEISPDMLSLVFSIMSNDQEKTFGNFPNPFGRPPNETTEIRFLLQATSDVTLRIFSLAGELVRSGWNRNLTNLPGAGGEIYYVVWDGKNDEGYTVLNGVYICVIEIRSSSGTKTYTTKIAYIK